jgi:arylsulfatase A-like enzyme
LPGLDLADDLLAGREPRGRESVFAYHDAGMAMLRTRDAKYLRYEPHGSEVLYDLADDPDELHNVADHPDQADRLQRLRLDLLRRSLAAGASPQRRLHPF